jgi:hypothetical protein
VTVLADTWQTAKKPHICDACVGVIAAGDNYRRQRIIGEDGPYVYKCHALCDAVYWRAHRRLELMYDESLDDSEIREELLSVFAALAPPIQEKP